MERIRVKKVKGRELSETLRSMRVGDELHIRDKEFRTSSVHNACHRLRGKGYDFVCSSRGSIDGCIVTRTM